MEINHKQNNLTGIDTIIKGYQLSDHVHQLFTTQGLKALAIDLDTDPATLSRFKSDQAGMTLTQLEKLIEHGDLVLIPRKKLKRIISNWFSATDMAEEAMGWK